MKRTREDDIATRPNKKQKVLVQQTDTLQQHDVCKTIFQFLTAPSLIPMRSVCKSWQQVIQFEMDTYWSKVVSTMFKTAAYKPQRLQIGAGSVSFGAFLQKHSYKHVWHLLQYNKVIKKSDEMSKEEQEQFLKCEDILVEDADPYSNDEVQIMIMETDSQEVEISLFEHQHSKDKIRVFYYSLGDNAFGNAFWNAEAISIFGISDDYWYADEQNCADEELVHALMDTYKNKKI